MTSNISDRLLNFSWACGTCVCVWLDCDSYTCPVKPGVTFFTPNPHSTLLGLLKSSLAYSTLILLLNCLSWLTTGFGCFCGIFLSVPLDFLQMRNPYVYIIDLKQQFSARACTLASLKSKFALNTSWICVEGGSMGCNSEFEISFSGVRKCPVQNPEHLAHSLFPQGLSWSGTGRGMYVKGGPPGNHVSISRHILPGSLQRGWMQFLSKQHTRKNMYWPGNPPIMWLCRTLQTSLKRL